jgi:membrane protein implicated in regulation of membrane protease activity
MDLGKWGVPVNLVAVVMGGLLVINIGWPRAEIYDVAGAGWYMQYFAIIFVALTLVVGYVAYRVVRDRDGAPDPVDALVGKRKST